MYTARYTVHSTLCTQCTLHTTQCTAHSAHSVHCTLHSAQHTLHTVYTALCTVHNTLCTQCTLHSAQCTLHSSPGMATCHLHTSEGLDIYIPQGSRDHFLDTGNNNPVHCTVCCSVHCIVQCTFYTVHSIQLTCLFTRLESLPWFSRVSDSPVSAETVIYEAFVLIG